MEGVVHTYIVNVCVKWIGGDMCSCLLVPAQVLIFCLIADLFFSSPSSRLCSTLCCVCARIKKVKFEATGDQEYPIPRYPNLYGFMHDFSARGEC